MDNWIDKATAYWLSDNYFGTRDFSYVVEHAYVPPPLTPDDDFTGDDDDAVNSSLWEDIGVVPPVIKSNQLYFYVNGYSSRNNYLKAKWYITSDYSVQIDVGTFFKEVSNSYAEFHFIVRDTLSDGDYTRVGRVKTNTYDRIYTRSYQSYSGRTPVYQTWAADIDKLRLRRASGRQIVEYHDTTGWHELNNFSASYLEDDIRVYLYMFCGATLYPEAYQYIDNFTLNSGDYEWD